ncbi:uncharacterized protein B0I36DRAFT_407901 [Microdochium trichocladiopsis]|uniref:ABM domain-containing protein n=1 Tax=Microdochium trichocladiopsis TaxID=1682393 RepID=A0A9P8YBE8_9PEZI|nr:uncharacterized protein B0I36DRAFT_407901 [Microdochium trichocladiopsis]KAH7033239.1 hypothetical protein B0I36DRAFT_407901 [Microdochium trichocladiopsis]
MSDMYLFANVNFVPGHYGDWQAAYDKLAEYVWSEEKSTKTYYFGIPFDYASDVSNTTLMFAFEVYENMAALTDVHLKSSTMGTFLKTALPCMTTGLDLLYYSYAAGFLDKPGDKRECGVMHDMRIHCTTPAGRDVVEKALREQVEPAVSKEDDGVYTWLVCRLNDDDKEIRVYSRFRSSEDLERYLRMPEVQRFWREHGQTEVATLEQRGMVTPLRLGGNSESVFLVAGRKA